MNRIATSMHLATLAVVVAAALQSGCATWREEDKARYMQTDPMGRTEVPRYHREQRERPPAPAPAQPAPRPEPRPAASNEFTIKSNLLQVHKRVPAQGTLGQNLEAELTITALDNCAEAVVVDYLPEGASFVKAEPPARVEGNKLVWDIGNMDRGQVIRAKVWYRADREGMLVNCATLSAIPRGCAGTMIGKPALSIEKSGPATARLGSDVTYTIVVRNTGSSDAENVVVTDNIPDGLAAPGGERVLTFNVGTLAPGASRSIPVTLRTTKRGEVCNVASVRGTGLGELKDDACTVVVQPGLKVEKSGTKEQFVGRTATYQVVVSNTGDTDLRDVVVTDTAPAATRIVSATGATISGNTATWRIANLAKGGRQSFEVVLTSGTAGRHCNSVSAAAEGLREVAEACTDWRGQAALLIEVVDDPDPISVGEATRYTIRVTNQGTADDTNIRIAARFGAEIDPTSASGATAGTVTGKNVTFAPVPRLSPKQSVTWTVTAKGVSAGDHRLKVDLTSDLLKTPVVEEESTHVY
ncbi:MAG: DUF11 domain-containing protein [Verrucomicrobiae bacterium]|nr:DUF11 domain-containing protein [Verrucomicrobiae bacterium]